MVKELVGIKISTLMIAQYMDDVSFALLGVHLFLLATSNVMREYATKQNHHNVGAVQPCLAVQA